MSNVYEQMGCKKYSRVEVIGNGREYVYRGTVWLCEQDNGRTIKVFKEEKR